MPVIVCSSVAEAHETLRDGTSAVVVVPIHNAYEDVMQCLEALVRHSHGGGVHIYSQRRLQRLGKARQIEYEAAEHDARYIASAPLRAVEVE